VRLLSNTTRLPDDPVKRFRQRRGFTLIELAVVMGIIIVMVLIALPSIQGMTSSANVGAANTMLRSLLASTRAMAANTQEYIGIRFQQDRFGRSWAVFLRQARSKSETAGSIDPYINYANGCPIDPTAYGSTNMGPYSGSYAFPDNPNCDYLVLVASSTSSPIALPRGLELAAGNFHETDWDKDNDVDNVDADLGLSTYINNSTTFTVVFSPSGQVVRKRVFVGQKGYEKNTGTPQRHDTVFNKLLNENPTAIPANDIPLRDRKDILALIPDWDADPSDGVSDVEISQNSIWIYERQKRIDAGMAPFSGYVASQGQKVTLNVYTGSLIAEQ